MEKLYDRIDWANNTSPALNQTNLNKMSKAIDDIDDRVVDIAGTIMETVPQIQEDLAEAAELVEDAEAITTHPPMIGQNGNWWVWDTETDAYVDSGIDAGVSISVGTTTTLPAGNSATVTNVGTDTDPILNFGIPQGATGQNGQDGQDGVSPEVTITTITGGHTVTITDADHPSGQSFNVMDGADGGGHTIINSAGTSMTQRAGLQFEGMGVSDDSTNDKTVVTLPTPDYVDEQFNSTTTYTKGMTCISGNKRYRYINSNATSGHQPPDATYWVEESVASEGWKYAGSASWAPVPNSSDKATIYSKLQDCKVAIPAGARLVSFSFYIQARSKKEGTSEAIPYAITITGTLPIGITITETRDYMVTSFTYWNKEWNTWEPARPMIVFFDVNNNELRLTGIMQGGSGGQVDYSRDSGSCLVDLIGGGANGGYLLQAWYI